MDIAVNDMMGYEFAQYVNKCLEKNGYPTRNIAKIDSNPAKSKHLETATTKLFNIEVDFANLRTEVYEEDSRIPSAIVSDDHVLWESLFMHEYRPLALQQKMLIDVTQLSTACFTTSTPVK